MKTKIINCIHCKKEMEVGLWSPFDQACISCIEKGLKDPIREKHEKAKLKRKQTMLKKYGVENPNQLKTVHEKIKKTNLEKYGGTGFSSKELKEKSISKIKEKYNTDNYMKTEKARQQFSGDNNPLKQEKARKKLSKSLSGRPSKLKNRTYKEIHGKEKAKELIKNRQNLFLERFLKNDFPKLLDYLNFDFIDENYKGAHYFHNYRCKKCKKVMKKQWYSIQQGYQCNECFPRKNGKSLAEKEVYKYIKKMLPNEKILTNTKKIIPPKELDIYIPNKKVAIEYNGLYWHSNLRDINPKYHMNKTTECLTKNIRLIQIFEDEWIYKKNIVKSRLKEILNISDSTRVHARKCMIKEIEPKIKDEFLNEYHIQGKDLSTIKLGAFYQEELISVMTFSKGNRAKGSKAIEGVWELNRFCSHPKYHIPGIASKLLSHFKNNYHWNEIFSYADRRWSNGNLYNKLGFTLEKGIRLNYWYFKGYKRYHRFSLRKRKDEPKDISEKTLRLCEGYNIIWDCGNLKFTLKNKTT